MTCPACGSTQRESRRSVPTLNDYEMVPCEDRWHDTTQTPSVATAPQEADENPPAGVIAIACEQAAFSPCRSKRGAVVFSQANVGVVIHGRGHNRKPEGFSCDGSAECKESCRIEAVHAEQRALLNAGWSADGADLMHVKVVDRALVESGGPSCVECSKLALAAGITGVWLYHGLGWKRYKTAEFHALSLAARLTPEAQAGDHISRAMLHDYSDEQQLPGRIAKALPHLSAASVETVIDVIEHEVAARLIPEASSVCRCGTTLVCPDIGCDSNKSGEEAATVRSVLGKRYERTPFSVEAEPKAEASSAPTQEKCNYHALFDGTCARGSYRCPDHHPVTLGRTMRIAPAQETVTAGQSAVAMASGEWWGVIGPRGMPCLFGKHREDAEPDTDERVALFRVEEVTATGSAPAKEDIWKRVGAISMSDIHDFYWDVDKIWRSAPHSMQYNARDLSIRDGIIKLLRGASTSTAPAPQGWPSPPSEPTTGGTK